MGYSGSPDEIRVIIAAEVDRAIAAFDRAASAMGTATGRMGQNLEGMGETSLRVQKKMEHFAIAVGFSMGSLATSTGSAVERIGHALTALGFSVDPVLGAIALVASSVVAQYVHMNDEADKFADHGEKAFGRYTTAALRAGKAAAIASQQRIYGEIQEYQYGQHEGALATIPKELAQRYDAALKKVSEFTAALRDATQEESRQAAADAPRKQAKAWADAAEAVKRYNAALEDDLALIARRMAYGGKGGILDEAATKAVEKEAIDSAKAIAEAQKKASDDALATIIANIKKWLDAMDAATEQIKKQQNAIESGFKEAFESIPNAAERAFRDVIQAGESMKAFWRFLVQEMAAAFAQSVWHMVSVWAAGELAKKAITHFSVAERVAAEKYGAVATIAIALWEGAKWIAIQAAKAAAAAWAAIAGIPFAGPFLAPIAAAAALAGVLALGATIASAAGGYDIPAGVNPITRLHAQEMVLPKRYADVIRNLDGAGGGDTYHIWAMDGADVERVLMRNPNAVARAAQRGVKNGGTDSGIGRRGGRNV